MHSFEERHSSLITPLRSDVYVCSYVSPLQWGGLLSRHTSQEAVGLKQYIAHLGKHLSNREMITCPFTQCPFKSNIFSSFTSHTCHCHPHSTLKEFITEITVKECEIEELVECEVAESQSDVPLEDNSDNEPEDHETIEIQGRLASLLLQMQAVLHVFKLATQEIVSEFYEIGVLIGELNKYTVKRY